MKYDGVILLMALSNLAMFCAGVTLILHAWVYFIISLLVFLVASGLHAWRLVVFKLRHQGGPEDDK